MKTKLWDTLLAVLQDILALYQTLLTLSETKRQVLVAANAKELEAITKQEELVLLEVARLDRQRQVLVKQLAEMYGQAEATLTFSQLRQLAEAREAAWLLDYEEAIQALLKRLKPLNELNTKLIEQSLGYVQYNINVLTRTAVGPSYAPRGENGQEPSRPTRVFDAKI